MRRTGLSALALACTAVLAGAVPAFADGASQAPTTVPSAATPTERPSTTAAPSPVPTTGDGASAEPTRAPSRDQVSVVPSGAPNTGVADGSSGSGGALVGGGAAAAVVVGGGAVLLVRRRRAHGA